MCLENPIHTYGQDWLAGPACEAEEPDEDLLAKEEPLDEMA